MASTTPKTTPPATQFRCNGITNVVKTDTTEQVVGGEEGEVHQLPTVIRLSLNEMTSIEVVLDTSTQLVTKRIASEPDIWSPMKLLSNEAAIYERLGPDPPGILKCKGRDNQGGLLLEWAYRKDLWNHLWATPATNLGKRMEWCLSLTEAIQFCHEKSIAIIDIHPRNVLLTHDLRALLSDFGYSSLDFEFSPGKTHPAYSGAIRYRPDDRRLEDLVSLGHLFYFIFNNHHPYEEWTEEMIFDSYRQQVYPILANGMPKELKSVLRGCWDGDYFAATDILKDLKEAVRCMEERAEQEQKNFWESPPEWIRLPTPHRRPSGRGTRSSSPTKSNPENPSSATLRNAPTPDSASESGDEQVVFQPKNGLRRLPNSVGNHTTSTNPTSVSSDTQSEPTARSNDVTNNESQIEEATVAGQNASSPVAENSRDSYQRASKDGSWLDWVPRDVRRRMWGDQQLVMTPPPPIAPVRNVDEPKEDATSSTDPNVASPEGKSELFAAPPIFAPGDFIPASMEDFDVPAAPPSSPAGTISVLPPVSVALPSSATDFDKPKRTEEATKAPKLTFQENLSEVLSDNRRGVRTSGTASRQSFDTPPSPHTPGLNAQPVKSRLRRMRSITRRWWRNLTA